MRDGEQGLKMSFAIEDATRTPLSRISKFLSAAIAAGAQYVRLADTVGILTPTETTGLIRAVRPMVTAHLGVHGDRQRVVVDDQAPLIIDEVVRADMTAATLGCRPPSEEREQHTIKPVGPNKPNATMAKLKRYSEFITGLAKVEPRTTWYAAKFPDGLKPELVLVEPSERRVAHVQEAVTQWVRERYQGKEPFKIRVLTPGKSGRHFRTR